jgi:hypothetical protein
LAEPTGVLPVPARRFRWRGFWRGAASRRARTRPHRIAWCDYPGTSRTRPSRADQELWIHGATTALDGVLANGGHSDLAVQVYWPDGASTQLHIEF